jgi:hypothetical protein
MIMHPAIIALFLGSVVVSLMVLYAAYYGIRIVHHWDLTSGSEMQLGLEKQTYLVSTLMSYALLFQLFSLFLFIFTADKLSSLFVGAMCAAGTLNVNGYGYPALLLKILNFVLGGAWLVVNYTDNRAVDYPLIKKKYVLLLAMAPLILGEMFIQGAYFLNLNAHVITSCCGALFSPEGTGAGSFILALPVTPVKVAFVACLFFSCCLGVLFIRRQTALTGYSFAFACVLTFVVSVAALISFISLYVYELPTHHCPFCILQAEYHYVGYPLYLALLGAAVAGASTGFLTAARDVPSLREALPPVQRRLAMVAIALLLVFAALSSWVMVFTDFRLS